MENARHLRSLSDDELLRRLRALAERSRRVEADLVAHVGEVDARRLWAREAVSSMFAYCTQRLHLSEDAAYRRIEVARAARKGVAEAKTAPSSRDIPAPVRRAVYERDGGRCRHVDARGRRCTERHRLEYHHHNPHGLGGDHRVENVRPMCHAHNALLAEQDYGKEKMARYRGSRCDRVSEATVVYQAGT